MRLYYEIALRSFRRATIYRSAYIAGLLTNAFFGALITFVYLAVYQAGGSVSGFNVQDAVSYAWATQALISVGGAWVSGELGQTIKSGDVISDLSRPWSFYGYWMSRTIGEWLFNLLVRGAMTYLIGVLYFSARVPTAYDLLAFGVALCLAMVVSFAYSFIVNLTAFWMIDNSGLMLIANIVLMFFSGFLMPLAFFPAPLARLAQMLPFQAITGLPAQVFLGRINGPALIQTLLLQLFWAIVLTGLAALILRAAVRKVVIQGG